MKVSIIIHILLSVATTVVALLGLEVTINYTKREKKPIEKPLRELTLSFSGDAIQHLPQVSAARRADGTFDYSGNFRHIDTVWRSVDFAVINYETTVSANGRYTGYPQFSSPAEFAAQLRHSGISVAALANNHCADKGLKGITKTIATMDSLGIKTVGVYADSASAQSILMLNKSKFRVALLNYTYDTNGIPVPRGTAVNLIDTVKMLQDIVKARTDSAATHVIAFMHWGNEYQRRASREQERIGMWLRRNGVDVVVGSHPHVVQGIDTANRIVYSLGNFVSNQQDRYTDSGLTVVVRLEHKNPPQIEYIPHWCDKFAPTAKEKYRVLTERDTVMLTPENAERLKRAISEARQAVGEAREMKIWSDMSGF